MFISEKFLDTPLFRLIRFRQKVLTVQHSVGTILPCKKKAAQCRVAFLFGEDLRRLKRTSTLGDDGLLSQKEPFLNSCLPSLMNCKLH
jgi:hypothetical protein